MGGDGGPATIVPAAAAMADRADIVLVGDARTIRRYLPGAARRVEVLHAAEVVGAGDSLADVLRRRPDSSMRRALSCHAEGAVDAVVSGGDTGALMALSRSLLDMVDGVERPAICKELHGMQGSFWMLDLGANIDCTSTQLHQFARMGDILARHVGQVAAPRTALLNIGTEVGKGPEVLAQASERLAADPQLTFGGFIEGNELFSGAAEVVVSDGFTGNVALKSVEGAARMAGHLLDRWTGRLGALERLAMLTARRKLGELRHLLNPQRYNGACFVGLRGVVVKSHGSADAEGFSSAIEEAVREVQGRIPLHLGEALAGR